MKKLLSVILTLAVFSMLITGLSVTGIAAETDTHTSAYSERDIYDRHDIYYSEHDDYIWSQSNGKWIYSPKEKITKSEEKWKIVKAEVAIAEWTPTSLVYLMPEKSLLKSGNKVKLYRLKTSTFGFTNAEKWEMVTIQHLIDKNYKKTLVMVLDQKATSMKLNSIILVNDKYEAMVYKTGSTKKKSTQSWTEYEDEQNHIDIDMRW